MDRTISSKEKRKKQLKALAKVGAIVIVVAGIVMILNRALGDSLYLDELTIGKAETGSIETTIGAAGRLSPLEEENIVAPISSRILEVYKNPGDSVKEGEPLLKLDLSSVETEYNKKLNEKEIRKSKLVQIRINLENSISSMRMQQQISEMRLKQLETDYRSEKYLDSIGASTGDKVRRVELSYEEAKLELQQLKQKIANEEKSSAAEMRVQELEFANFESTLAETERLLKDARVFSPRTATLTFINNQIGMQVATGAHIATVADLGHFKVNSEVSDLYAEKIVMGAKAIVETGNEKYTGSVVNITPSSSGGVVKFTVALDDTGGQRFRSGTSAEVYVRHGILEDVLRIPNAPCFGYGPGTYDVWVIEGNKAVKRKVSIGESSFEYVKVENGLQPGEEVILSDMIKFKKKETVKIKR